MNGTSRQAHHHHPPSGRRRSISDPLAVALLPPPNETQAERESRLRTEQEAKKRSDTIDKMIRDDERQSRKRKVVKVLLLGQSESGKSTTLKQFQLLHTPAAFHAERIAWRFVIYLNLLRSIRRILDAISPENDGANDEADDYETSEPAAIIISASGNGNGGTAQTNATSSATSWDRSVPNYDRYLRALTPLLELEQRLMRQLSDPEDNDEHEPTRLPKPQHHQQQHTNGYGNPSPNGNYASTGTSSVRGKGNGHGHGHGTAASASGDALPKIVIPSSSRSLPTSPVSPSGSSSSHSTDELAVRAASQWKSLFALGKISGQSQKDERSGEVRGWWEDPADPVHVLNRCAPTMMQLWKDARVRLRLHEKRIRLEESSGFYLEEIPRITAKMYFPTDDDVLKARLKTTGVVEHTFSVTSGEFKGADWRIYDVGGARHQRQAWAPYFDDVNAIIFLAPISAFDQVLAEDPTINRVQDSMYLWRDVVGNPLLAPVNIILFLNKSDLLKKKLQSGIRLRDHMRQYGDQPNNYDTVVKYFKNKFGAIHQSRTPDKSRELYVHVTSVTDKDRTRTIILTVRDIILQGNLRSTALM